MGWSRRSTEVEDPPRWAWRHQCAQVFGASLAYGMKRIVGLLDAAHVERAG